jgi:PHD/YefM family antitoxin component YafN of YafNO toxin-antitoxin module
MSTLTVVSQSVSEFRDNATETLDRINKTGEAEILTVDGEVRAVILAPAVFEAMAAEVHLNEDVAMIQKSLKEIKNGQFQEAHVVFADIRKQLLAMKHAQENATQ